MAGLLGPALVRYLAERGTGDVYVDPAGFTRFIDGGGNVDLYRAVIAALATRHTELRPATVLDIGCGDGRVTAGVVTSEADVTIVEPSAEMLATASERLPLASAHQGTLATALSTFADRRWSVAQSTFALHAIEPAARADQLRELAERCDTLLVVEFDVPSFADRSPEHAGYLAERYEAGLAEYPGDDVVAQGFLMPVLVGQLDPSLPRHTWEQPIDDWLADLAAAGFAHVTATKVADYWWAPAFLIEARTS